MTRAEHHAAIALRILGACSCHAAYKMRDLIAPDCVWHDCHEEMEEALEEAYQRGLKNKL
jgi:hypothetical protein